MTDQPDRPRTGIILGFLFGGGLLIGLSMFASWRKGIEPQTVPATTIVTRDTTVANPVRLVFTSSVPLELMDMGWMAGGRHLHVILDSTDIMAGAADMMHVAADTFAWTLPPVPPGTHLVRLFWSDARHLPVGDTTTAPLTVH